jgi:hypothetical protein
LLKEKNRLKKRKGRFLCAFCVPLSFDLDVDSGGKRQPFEGVDGFPGGIEDVDQTLVRADLELLTRLSVDVGRAASQAAILQNDNLERLTWLAEKVG